MKRGPRRNPPSSRMLAALAIVIGVTLGEASGGGSRFVQEEKGRSAVIDPLIDASHQVLVGRIARLRRVEQAPPLMLPRYYPSKTIFLAEVVTEQALLGTSEATKQFVVLRTKESVSPATLEGGLALFFLRPDETPWSSASEETRTRIDKASGGAELLELVKHGAWALSGDDTRAEVDSELAEAGILDFEGTTAQRAIEQRIAALTPTLRVSWVTTGPRQYAVSVRPDGSFTIRGGATGVLEEPHRRRLWEAVARTTASSPSRDIGKDLYPCLEYFSFELRTRETVRVFRVYTNELNIGEAAAVELLTAVWNELPGDDKPPMPVPK